MVLWQTQHADNRSPAAEVLRGLRNFLDKDRSQKHSLWEREANNGERKLQFLRQSDKHSLNQSNIGTVLSAAMGWTAERQGGPHMGFFKHYSIMLPWTETGRCPLHMALKERTWPDHLPVVWKKEALWWSFFFFFCIPSYISGFYHSSSAFPTSSLGFTILLLLHSQLYLWGSLFWVRFFAYVTIFNSTIMVVTFCLCGWWMLCFCCWH